MRRKNYLLSLAFCSIFLFQSADAIDITLTGEAAFTARQKAMCGTTDKGVLRYGVFEGRTYSRVPGEKDRHLFNVLGINVRHCNVLNDEKLGKGFRSVSREIMVYMDPETGEVLDSWKNPWSGEMVDVIHVANDPVNMRQPIYEIDSETGKASEFTYRKYDNTAALSFEVPLFYENALGGDYQKYIGGTYHAMEIFNYFYDADSFSDPEIKNITGGHLAWSRVSQWLPWLEMGSRPGIMIFNATGFTTLDKDKIPSELIKILKDRYPAYLSPPPLDDDRKNETSWTVFKKAIDEKREK